MDKVHRVPCGRKTRNYERPLVFAHVILTKNAGSCQAKEIRVRISWRQDLWEAGIHDGLVEDT